MWGPVLRKLSAKGLLRKDKISNLDKSCCASEQIVLDFDFAKDGICTLMRLPTPKSADCLYYNKNNNSLYFIEMKDLSYTMNEINSQSFSNITDVQNHLLSKLESFGIHDKIFDSYMVGLLILKAIGINTAEYRNFVNKENLNIHFILLVKASSSDYLRFRTSILGMLKRYSFRAFSSPQVNLVRCDDLDTFIAYLNSN